MKPNLSLIAAVAENNVIGKNNNLIWHLPNDLKYFKKITSEHTIIMGRKNFEAIGRALPNRKSVVISRNKNYKAKDCVVVNNIEEAVNQAKGDDEPFVIGGGEIYKQMLSLVNKIYLTRVHASFKGDTFFPELDKREWKLISEEKNKVDDKHKYPYTFFVYERIS